MFDKAVVDPAVLFIAVDSWDNEERRDLFLKHLIDNLTNIVSYNICEIYWSNELEAMLWTDPQIPPWRLDRDWQLQMIPIIYDKFSKCRIILEECTNHSPLGTIVPALREVCSHSLHSHFLQLIQAAITRNDHLFFCVGLGNQLSSAERYQFGSSTGDKSFEPVLVNCPQDWFSHIDAEALWPCDTTEISQDGLRSALEIVAIQLGLKEPGGESLYSYSASKRFLSDLCGERLHKTEILRGMAKRLNMSQMAASRDTGLNDESIRGRMGIRRFRVTRACRIHYTYEGSEHICFLEYYGEGAHDDGL